MYVACLDVTMRFKKLFKLGNEKDSLIILTWRISVLRLTGTEVFDSVITR